MRDSINWLVSKFPEALWPVSPDCQIEYNVRCIMGRELMRKKSVVICGLARNVEDKLPLTIARIEKLGRMFRGYTVVIYENDSNDSTPDILKNWEEQNDSVTIISEKLGLKQHEQVMTPDRTTDMAYYRNQYLARAKKVEADYLIVVDTDLEGGWSYEGVANSFGYDDWDMIGSNSLLYRVRDKILERLFYDTFAFRRIGVEHEKNMPDLNLLIYNRGEELVRVNSVFGGLAIYRKEVIKPDMWYESYDCDHPTLNKQIREDGHTNLFLNPSQITLYSKSPYCLRQ